MVQVQGSPYKKSNEGKEKGNQKVVDEGSGLQKADKGIGKEKVVDEGAGLQKADKGRGKEKVVDEGADLQKPDKGKGKQKVVDEDSNSWSDEIFDDSDDNFEGLGEDVSDESDFDIETMPEDRTDDSDEGNAPQTRNTKNLTLIPFVAFPFTISFAFTGLYKDMGQAFEEQYHNHDLHELQIHNLKLVFNTKILNKIIFKTKLYLTLNKDMGLAFEKQCDDYKFITS
ncbi:hypothetical protein VNO77_19578 [Canavalia gladiata]|uniref:Uncharacterized protein n=1 Tax=Canavalia gladiata TaxID=3824 RepID=A0AAN9QKK7_CANGL